MVIAFTGHRSFRPHTIAKYRLKSLLECKAPDKVISGMAIGWDQFAAEVSLDIEIPRPIPEIIAAVPFKGQERVWPPSTQENYQVLLHEIENRGGQIHYVCSPGYAPWKMQRRNEWMVDQADLIVAWWDGSRGGTGNCIRYAQSRGKEIINLYEA